MFLPHHSFCRSAIQGNDTRLFVILHEASAFNYRCCSSYNSTLEPSRRNGRKKLTKKRDLSRDTISYQRPHDHCCCLLLTTMRFFSRMSRQSTPEAPADLSSSPEDVSPVDQRGSESEQPTSPSPAGMSTGRDSEGYPTWLPKRPPPPAPASTFQSSEGHQAGQAQAGPSEQPYVGGRKPTPRSVRIVSLQEPYGYGEKDRREPTDQTRVSNPMHPRVWSRATGAGVSPTVFSSDPFQSRIPQPKFRSRGLHLELLRNPSPKSRIYFYLFQLFVFAHIPLQTFFDFNAVFILFQ